MLRITLDRSPLLERWIAAMHLLALIATWAAEIVWYGQLALTAALLADYWAGHVVGRANNGRQQLVYSDRTGWTLEEDGKAARPLTILPGSVVSPWCVILHARDGRKFRSWVIARDSLDAEGFRWLRVDLRVFRWSAGYSRMVSDSATGTDSTLFR